MTNDSPAPAPEEESVDQSPRQVTEAQELRALTHPVRLALLEVLNLHGPLTATEAGERIGESPTTCSFHLRQLSKYGFVEEAGGGAGRRRPWRLARRSISFSGEGDLEQTVAARELARLLMQRWLVRHEKAEQNPEPGWSEVTGAMVHTSFLTLEEADQLRSEVTALFDRYRERSTDASRRPAGARAIESVLLVHPFGDEADAD